MSRNVFRGETELGGFEETLGSVPQKPAGQGRRSGSSRLQSGLQAMFEKAKTDGHQEGKAEGFAVGHEDGLAQGRSEFEESHEAALRDFRTALQEFVDHAQDAVDDWYTRAEETLSTLAVEISRRAVCKELEVSRECVVEITQQALTEVRHGTEVRVKVNPLDAAVLDARRPQILASVAGIRKLEIVPDLSVASGCVIETDGGVIDARIESYLSRLAQEAA